MNTQQLINEYHKERTWKKEEKKSSKNNSKRYPRTKGH